MGKFSGSILSRSKTRQNTVIGLCYWYCIGDEYGHGLPGPAQQTVFLKRGYAQRMRKEKLRKSMDDGLVMQLTVVFSFST